jgi:hypothetical protein
LVSKAAAVMFSIGQINDLHARLGSASTLPEYVRALKALGVERYDSYLADGHSEYFGQGGHRVVSLPVHEVLPVAEPVNARIEKWTVDTGRMTMTFYDKAGREMLVEQIK